MRQLLIFFVIVCLVGVPFLARADDNSALYEVADVPADITADSAAHARDQAIALAQHSAFSELLGRLGADPSIGAKLDDDTLAALVQSFEVQDEHSSSVRYIGTFTVQFRPDAVRNWLNQNNISFTEVHNKPVVILPVLMSNGHPVLWEVRSKWWTIWQNEPRGGYVPIVLPAGDLNDIALLSTDDAMNGNASAIKSIIGKYQAGGAAVVKLDGNPDTPGTGFKIDAEWFGPDGQSSTLTQFNLPPAVDRIGIDNDLTQAVRQVRAALEAGPKQSAAKTASTPSLADAPVAPAVLQLPVVVPIQSLTEWQAIRRKLTGIPGMTRAELVTLARNSSNIELEYRGDIDELQTALALQNLALTKDSASGVWTLQVTIGSL